MYNFIDVTEVSEATLPSEALQINGEFIENLIEGYRTLHVSGREALPPELMSFETGTRNGSNVQNKRFPARTIVVTYQLIAKSNEAFRAAYNALGRILCVDNAELIFNDEQDKYFIGTPSHIEEVEAGRNAVVGTFELYCADPFKYSVVEYEAKPWEENSNSILIDYGGTYKAYPTLEANFAEETEVADDGTAKTLTGNGDCGYVAFFNESEKIIQLGDPDEVDTETHAKSQTLLNQTFQTSGAWGSTAKGLWTANNGFVLPANVSQQGSLQMGVASYSETSTPAATSGTLISVACDVEAPTINYKVTAKTSNRTANSVNVDMTITAALAQDSAYFGRGFGLKASVYIGGAWRSVTLKTTSDYWRGRTAHTVNLSVALTGLSASTASLTDIQFKVERTDNVGGKTGILGATACNNLQVSIFETPVAETYYLEPASYGSASDVYHGPSITRTLPKDSTGATGAANFTLTYKQKLSIGSDKNDTNQLGAFQVQLLTADGQHVAGIRIYKNTSGTHGGFKLYVNNTEMYETAIDLSYNNAHFGSKENAVKTTTISKSGDTVTFTIGGMVRSYKSSAITNLATAKVTFSFEKYSTHAALSHNGLYWVKFVKDNCATQKDIPNKFSANDVVVADCKDGKIYLNGVETASLGALGNDWEDFVLTYGLNQIGFSCSDWTTNKPSYKIRYREVFL